MKINRQNGARVDIGVPGTSFYSENYSEISIMLNSYWKFIFHSISKGDMWDVPSIEIMRLKKSVFEF
jgi:hypothetical protein